MSARPYICVPKDGSFPTDALIDLMSRGARFTADPNFDQAIYLEDLADQSLGGLITFDRDSFPTVDWDAVRAEPHLTAWQVEVQRQLQWYEAEWEVRPTIINVWNEFAGTGGDEESPMPAYVINEIARFTRERFGQNQFIAHGSTVDGQPSTLKQLDWRHVNFADLHLYAKVAPDWNGDPMTGVLDLEPYRAVLPSSVGIIISEIGLSSWPNQGDPVSETRQSLLFQASYCESIIGHCVSLDDLYLVSWFAGHNHRGFGVVDDHGTPKPSYDAYRRAAATYKESSEPDPGGHTMAMTKAQYEALWKAVEPNAVYRHDFGIERYWRDHIDELGSPTQVEQQDGEWRAFSKLKIVQWTPQGAVVLP